MALASELEARVWQRRAEDGPARPISPSAAIGSTDALRRLRVEELPAVARAVRRGILQAVSRTGGHLGAGLGAVELATALHYVFDTPRDRLIWDVGHQGYPHKFLTGRRERFATLGQRGGLGKFLRRDESPYDVFGAGHAGTSVSAAVGVAEAIRRRGGAEWVVAVIGDGSLTAGMAFEGLNNAGGLGLDNLVVVLNDNGMSISPNVGALTDNFADEAGAAAAAWFEGLGFHYVGPVPGHDLPVLVETLESVRDGGAPRRPVVVHCRTEKGHGYEPAARDPVTYHGVGPFDVESGAMNGGGGGGASWTSVFASGLVELAQRDPRIVGITAAMADGTGLSRFRDAHPDRFYDVGIAEQHAVTMAAGMATEGLKPVCAIYSTFLQRAFDQVVHDVCLQNLDVTFAIDRAGLVGADGATHQGLYDFGYLRSLPNMLVMAPRDGEELRRMLRTAIEHPGPAALRFPRGTAPGVAAEGPIARLEVGQGELLRSGGDVALVAVGSAVAEALAAAQSLAEEGIDAAVLDARFVKPLDSDGIAALAQRTGIVVTVEEHAREGGFGEAVLKLLSDRGLRVSSRVLALPDGVLEHGDPGPARSACGIDAGGIARAARELVEGRRCGPSRMCEPERERGSDGPP